MSKNIPVEFANLVIDLNHRLGEEMFVREQSNPCQFPYKRSRFSFLFRLSREHIIPSIKYLLV